ncbi:MAG: endonuclease/exonuclease/phosphatase family protein [Fimbriimonadaceae bacterium]
MLKTLWAWAILLAFLQATRLGLFGAGWFYQLIAIIPDLVFIILASIPLIGISLKTIPLRTRLLPVFSAIIPAVIISFPCLGHQEVPKPDDLKVMTLNMEHGLEGSDLVAALIERESPDILFLQEAGPIVHPDGMPASLAHALAPYEMHKAIFEIVAVRGDILSRDIIDVPEMPHEQNATDVKAITAVVAKVKRIKLNLYTAHFSPGHTGRYGLGKLIWQLGELARVRTAQFSTLSKLGDSPLPSIVAGDLNEQPLGPNYRQLTQTWTDAFRTSGRGFGYTLKSTIPNHCSDYLLSRGIKPIRCVVLPDVVSDHRAVVAWYKSPSVLPLPRGASPR